MDFGFMIKSSLLDIRSTITVVIKHAEMSVKNDMRVIQISIIC